jgi:GAF domain-containing protein
MDDINTTNEVGGAAAELQELLLDTEDIAEFLQQLAAFAAQSMGRDVSCGITVGRDGRPVTVASSDDQASRVDEIQYGYDDGPCLTSMRTGEIRLIEDLAGDDRWGPYQTEALAHGVQASLSIPLRTRTAAPLGALNLYAGHPYAFGEQQQVAAIQFGQEASRAVALAARLANHAELAENLSAALASRTIIDQALGVIMGQNRCSADEAFQILRRASQNRNVKLRLIAGEIIAAVAGTTALSDPDIT